MHITIDQIFIAVAVLLVLYLLLTEYMCEGMSPTRERANKIYDWFTQEKNPQYINYRDDIDGAYNVEYYDIKNLKTQGNLTPDTIERIIS
jgi:hypothetical protein